MSNNNLIENIDKLHTTPMGVERIRRNLNLQSGDVVQWCREAVWNADVIIGQGKNWYIYKGGMVITVNVHSYTIITAHKLNAKIRDIKEADYECLPEFLYQAIFIPEGEELPPRGIINDPEIMKIILWLKNFKSRKPLSIDVMIGRKI